MVTEIRESLSNSLIRFATDRSIERGELERTLQGSGTTTPPSALAAMDYARLWESVVLWVGWRLQPRDHIWN